MNIVRKAVRILLMPIRWIRYEFKKIRFINYLNAKSPKTIFLLGTPNHNNIGDSAIALAEVLFMKKCGFEPKEITTNEFERYFKIVQNKTREKLICLHGGGNMGDQWLKEELLRRKMLTELKPKYFLILPQTFYYTDSTEGKELKEESKAIYSNNPLLTITAREKESFNSLKQTYANVDIIITPDIVLSLCPISENDNVKRSGVCTVFRNDAEKILGDDLKQKIIKEIISSGEKYDETDMIYRSNILKEDREKVVYDKIEEFSHYKLIITDRLHGMVFAALANTPCIVFSNCNHKIKGVFEWLDHLESIIFVNTIDEFKTAYYKLINYKLQYQKDICDQTLFNELKTKLSEKA